MRKLRTAFISFSLLALLGACWIGFYCPELVGPQKIRRGILAIQSHNLEAEITALEYFDANTYDEIPYGAFVWALYRRAARALAQRSDQVQTFDWTDRMGYPRQSTVLQTRGGYIEVRAASNNDNDSVSIRFTPGAFTKPDPLLD
jgi:hypothetical protein